MTNSDYNDPFRTVETDDIKPPPHYREGRSQQLTGDTGRQGPSGRRVLIVLVVSLFAAFAAWGVGGMFHWW
jgi:hypothetical protein